jgi:hypothetical protein
MMLATGCLHTVIVDSATRRKSIWKLTDHFRIYPDGEFYKLAPVMNQRLLDGYVICNRSEEINLCLF